MSGNFQLDFNFILWLWCGVSVWVLLMSPSLRLSCGCPCCRWQPNQRNLCHLQRGRDNEERLCEFLGGGELVKRCDPMLEARVINQLQKWKKSGQTTEQLENTLRTPQAKILIVLELHKEEGHVTKSENGVWTLVRGRTPDERPARPAGDDSNDAV